MLSTRLIRRKIRSVRNIKKITEAMKMVAAARLRRVQDRVAAGRPYAQKIAEILHRVAPHAEAIEHPLLEVRTPPQRIALVVITSDKGLCGSYNSNIIRAATRFIQQAEAPVDLILVGRKGRDFFTRRGYSVRASFTGMSSDAGHQEIAQVAQAIRQVYEAREVDQVHIAYTEFVSTMVHRPKVMPFLPFVRPEAGQGGPTDEIEYIFEPQAEKLLGSLIPRYVDSQMHQVLLEASASEQGARMLAMTNASNNAGDMIDALTLSFNKARQAGITRELLEVVAGADALEQSS